MDHSPILKNLKALMRETADFSRAWNLFFDLTERTDFVQASGVGRLDHLAPVLGVIGNADGIEPRRVFRDPVVMRYRNSDFYHGTVNCPGYLGAFMYFEDIDLGMFALTDLRSLESKFFRFALVLVDGRCNVVLPMQSGNRPTVH